MVLIIIIIIITIIIFITIIITIASYSQGSFGSVNLYLMAAYFSHQNLKNIREPVIYVLAEFVR